MKILYGKPVADEITKTVREQSGAVEAMLGRKPKLVNILCGEEAADIKYAKNAEKRMELMNMEAETLCLPRDISDAVFFMEFSRLNEDKRTDAILLMRPLPPQLNEGFVTSCIDTMKDVDGVSPVNAAGLYMGTEGFAPCTAQAVMELLSYYNIEVAGKHVVIVGRSAVVGKPLMMMLLAKDATVTVCHSKTKELEKICKKADILIAAAGVPKLITAEHIRKGAVVIDVGINVLPDGSIAGDVDFMDCEKKAKAMTPVPGGVGAVTTAVLGKHVLAAANRDIL